MAIKHSTTASSGDIIASANWNSDHTISGDISFPGNLTVGGLTVADISITNNTIYSTTGNISFSNENIVTTGIFSVGTLLLQTDFSTDKNITSTKNIKGNFYSTDSSAGITQTETGVTNFDIVIKNGLITSLTKN